MPTLVSSTQTTEKKESGFKLQKLDEIERILFLKFRCDKIQKEFAYFLIF